MEPINLLPQERRDRAAAAGKAVVWLRLCFVYALMLGIALLLGVLTLPTNVEALTAQLDATSKKIENADSRAAEMRTQLEALTRDLRRSTLVRSHPDWSPLFGLVAKQAGADIVLRRFVLGRPERDGAAHALTIEGVTRQQERISLFALRLEESGLFSVVNQVEQQRTQIGSAPGFSFTIECTLDGAQP